MRRKGRSQIGRLRVLPDTGDVTMTGVSVLVTENLELLLQSPEEVLASIEAMSPPDRAEVSPDWLARVKSSTSADPWTHGFAVVHRSSGTVIGSCGYKGPPGPEAIVEIAYGVDSAHQGRGYATEAARALIAFAFRSGLVWKWELRPIFSERFGPGQHFAPSLPAR